MGAAFLLVVMVFVHSVPLSFNRNHDSAQTRPKISLSQKENQTRHDVNRSKALAGDRERQWLDVNRSKALAGDRVRQWFQWIQQERNASISPDAVSFSHRGVAGMGHNLMRYSSIFHLGRCLGNVSKFYLEVNPNFKESQSIYAIPEYLFGQGPIVVSSGFFSPLRTREAEMATLPRSHPPYHVLSMSEEKEQAEMKGANATTPTPPLRRKVHFINNPPGYQPLFAHGQRSLLLQKNFYGKLQTDAEFYLQLLWLFQAQPHNQVRIKKVLTDMKAMGGNDPIVFGLHVRHGNGEKHDFARKRRFFDNLEEWVKNFLDMLSAYVQKGPHSQVFVRRPLVLFLATDSVLVIDQMRKTIDSPPHNATKRISLVTVKDHDYLQPGQGVTFGRGYKTRQEALKAWQDVMLDMYLLAQHCNVVIAGQYSSFTQSAPFSMMFEKALIQNQSNVADESQHPPYACEVGPLGNVMECFDKFSDWYEGRAFTVFGESRAPRQQVVKQHWFPDNFQSENPLRPYFKGTAVQATTTATEQRSGE